MSILYKNNNTSYEHTEITDLIGRVNIMMAFSCMCHPKRKEANPQQMLFLLPFNLTYSIIATHNTASVTITDTIWNTTQDQEP